MDIHPNTVHSEKEPNILVVGGYTGFLILRHLMQIPEVFASVLRADSSFDIPLFLPPVLFRGNIWWRPEVGPFGVIFESSACNLADSILSGATTNDGTIPSRSG